MGGSHSYGPKPRKSRPPRSTLATPPEARPRLKLRPRRRPAGHVTNDAEVVKRFGGWKSDAIHAYLYTDLAAAPKRAKEMLASRPVLQPHSNMPNRLSTRADYAETDGAARYGRSAPWTLPRRYRP